VKNIYLMRCSGPERAQVTHGAPRSPLQNQNMMMQGIVFRDACVNGDSSHLGTVPLQWLTGGPGLSLKRREKYRGYVPNTSNAWNVNFNNGNVNNNNKTNNNYVRPVRGSAWVENNLFSFSNIYRAYLECRKRKRSTINALRFELHLEDNLCKLERELKSKTYQPARSVCFIVKKPKLREIFAADFRDRIVHHILVGYLERIYEPKFIYDSWACRKNKGIHNAVLRLQKFQRQITSNGIKKAYYLQLDIKSFFINIHKEILFGLISSKTSNPDILWLLKKVLFNDCTKNYLFKGDFSLLNNVPAHKTLFNAPKDRGLPIGNLTSQFFANVYLNELDQFVKHTLKCRYYMRYTDDIVLLSGDMTRLLLWKKEIENFLKEKLLLELHPKRQKIRQVSGGIDFLGYIVRPKYMLVRKRVVNNYKQKLNQFEKCIKKEAQLNFRDTETVKKVNETSVSYLAHFKFANSYKLKKAMCQKYEFIDEIKRNINLTRPHYFSNLFQQYQFIIKALKEIVYLEDRNGQLYFVEKPNIVLFQVGRFYRFYGKDSKNIGQRIFGLKPAKNNLFSGFPVEFENKYLNIAMTSGYNVYIVNEKKDLIFSHRLLPRILTAKYLCTEGG